MQSIQHPPRCARRFLAVSAAYLLGSHAPIATPRHVDAQDIPSASGEPAPVRGLAARTAAAGDGTHRPRDAAREPATA
jgi:hypothetical protein